MTDEQKKKISLAKKGKRTNLQMTQEVKIIDGKKICGCCGKNKHVSEYHKCRTKRSGLKPACKSCRANQVNPLVHLKGRLKNLYGLTLDDYNRMFVKQKGCCAICGMHQSKQDRLLAVEHNHKTGQVRGLCCVTCNTGLGMLKVDDGVDLLTNAIKYLGDIV